MHEQLYQDIYQAELTHWWFRARIHIVTTLIRHFGPSVRPLLIADVGCGMGATLGALSQFGSVVGVDSSATALSYSESRGHPLLAASALPHLPFETGRFDIVCALDVIEHIDDDHCAVKELWRICKPGGLLVVTVPAFQWLWSEHDDINEHKRRYSRQSLRDCLAVNGTELLRLSYMNCVLAPPLMVFRLLRNCRQRTRSATASLRSDVFMFPRPINAFCYALFASEAIWLKHACLPFGVSLICVGRMSATAS
jgi:SAM-dependent methyltransferase